MTTLLAAVVPLLSTLVGAGITYWVNVRNRRVTRREDVFYEAIGAVATVRASRIVLTGMPPWEGASPTDFAAFMQELGRSQHLAYVHSVAEARKVVARASAYDRGLAPLLDKPDPFADDTNGPAIMNRLSAAVREDAS